MTAELIAKLRKWGPHLSQETADAIASVMEAQQNRIEQLEWENKGIEEWRGLAMKAFDNEKKLRALIARAEKDFFELFELVLALRPLIEQAGDQAMVKRIDKALKGKLKEPRSA